MMKQLVSLVFCALVSWACQSTYSARPFAESAAPSAALKLWNEYVKGEGSASGAKPECKPLLMRADPQVRQGLVMFFHGDAGCPAEFSALGARLAHAGFDVFMPLVPGAGRTTESHSFIRTMNEIARLAPRGDKVLAGLSGGGTLATEAALTAPELWDRILVYAPRAHPSLASISKIQVPLQFVGVRHEADAEGSALHNALKTARNARLCFYPEGVPHAMLRGAAPDSEAEAYWLPALEVDSLAFVTRGRWFSTLQVTQGKDRQATCRYAL